jgi:hypothetical protein
LLEYDASPAGMIQSVIERNLWVKKIINMV